MKESLFTDQPCQLCGGRRLQEYVVEGRSAWLWCRKCNLYQYGQLWTPEMYDGAYHNHYRAHRGRKIYTSAVRLNRIGALVDADSPRYLDVGSSIGCMLEAARRLGWDGVGVDVSQDMVNVCRERGLECVKIEDARLPFPDASFDIVTAWNVIEHVEDVAETLSEWRRVLKPGGVLAMETPDAGCLKLKWRGRRYKKFWKPEHTYTFSHWSLAEFMRRGDFEIVQTPVLGRLRNLPPAMLAYALAYQAQHLALGALGMQKSFLIAGRRSRKAAGVRRRRDLAA
jgi:SAM-dependent methyltransferase